MKIIKNMLRAALPLQNTGTKLSSPMVIGLKAGKSV